jgi:hypothetical protein
VSLCEFEERAVFDEWEELFADAGVDLDGASVF